MVHALTMLTQRRQWTLSLTLAHIHHGLHDQADDHARFVQSLADAYALPCIEQRVEVRPVAGNVEANARRLRYAALADIATQTATHFVLTAHHGDDQLETLLLRLMRGSGVRGLRGLRWRRKLSLDSDHANLRLLRPMLLADRAMVLDFLKKGGWSWCNDPTNDDLNRRRARLRQQVLPTLKAMSPGLSQRATRTATCMAQTHTAIASQAAQLDWQTGGDDESTGQWIDRETLRALPQAMVFEILRQVASGASGRQLTKATKAVLDHRGGQRVFQLAQGHQLIVERDRVWTTPL